MKKLNKYKLKNSIRNYRKNKRKKYILSRKDIFSDNKILNFKKAA